MAKKESNQKKPVSKNVSKSVSEILHDKKKSESECLKAVKKFFPWIGELVRKCQTLSVIKDEKQWIIKFEAILEMAASNVSKVKANEKNVFPQETDTALEKLITLLNNINSSSKHGFPDFDLSLAPVVEKYARVVMSLPIGDELKKNKFEKFLCSLSHHCNASLFGLVRCEEFVKICFPHFVQKPPSEASSEEEHLDEDEESSDEVEQGVSDINGKQDNNSYVNEDFISASENEDEPKSHRSLGTPKRQLKTNQMLVNKRIRFESTSSQLETRKFENGPIVLLEEARTSDSNEREIVGNSFTLNNDLDIIVADQNNEIESQSNDRPVNKKSTEIFRQPVGTSSPSLEEAAKLSTLMESQPKSSVSDPGSLVVRRLRSDDEDSLEELLTNCKKKSSKPRPMPLALVKEDATEELVAKKKTKNKANLCSKIVVQAEVHAPREPSHAVSTLSNAASRETSPAPNKPSTFVIPETPIKGRQQQQPTVCVTNESIPATSSSMKPATSLLEIQHSVIRSNMLSESACKLRLCELRQKLRERFKEQQHPDIFRITPTEKFLFKHLRVALRSKHRHNFQSWKIASSPSKKTGPKRISNPTLASGTNNPILGSSSAMKLKDSTARALTTDSQGSLQENSKLQTALSSKGSSNASSVALFPRVAEGKEKTLAAAADNSLCSFSAPPAFSTPVSAAPAYNGDSSSSTTICYASSSFKNASPNTAPFLFDEDSGIIAGDARKSIPNQKTINANLKSAVQDNLLGCSEPSESDSELMEELRTKIKNWAESSGSGDLICADPTQPLSDALMGNIPDSAVPGPFSSNVCLEKEADKPDVISSTDDKTVILRLSTQNQSEIATVATEQATIRRVSSRRAGISPLPICDDIEKFLYKNGSKFLAQTLNAQQNETNGLLNQDALPDAPKSVKVKTNQSTLDGFLNLKAPSNLKVSLHKRRTMAPDPEQCVSDASSFTLDDSASNSPKPAVIIKSTDRSKSKASLQQQGTSSANSSKKAKNKSKIHSSKSTPSKELGQLKAWTWEGFRKSLPPCWAEILDQHVMEHNKSGTLYYEPSNVPGVGNVQCACTNHSSQ